MAYRTSDQGLAQDFEIGLKKSIFVSIRNYASREQVSIKNFSALHYKER